MAETRLRVVDLFCGAGGLSLGFHAAGFEIAAGVDLDETCAESYRRNFQSLQPSRPPLVLGGSKGDLSRIDLADLGHATRPDVLIGGPPCQGFSKAGRAKLNSLSEAGFADDPRNRLYRMFLDAAREWRPRAVLMENVAGMRSVKGHNVAEDAAIDLAQQGYEVGYAVLNAAWYGVPQFRERFFLIGIRSDFGIQPTLPLVTHLSPGQPLGYARPVAESQIDLPLAARHSQLNVKAAERLDSFVTVGDAIGDLPMLTEHLGWTARPSRGDFRRTRKYEQPPHSKYALLMRNWPGFDPSESVDDHEIRFTPRDWETFRRMTSGDRYPEAFRIMKSRLQEALAQLAVHPESDSDEYQALRSSIVAPYPEHMFPDKWRKLFPDAPSWTVPAHLAKDTYSHIHFDDQQARSISVREAARLQSFPDAYHFAGNMGDCFRQIGNAVPPLLAESIARTLSILISLPR